MYINKTTNSLSDFVREEIFRGAHRASLTPLEIQSVKIIAISLFELPTLTEFGPLF